MPDNHSVELMSLFASAFISSTVAPGGSEGVLAWLASHSSIPAPMLLATATAGNTLGAVTTIILGALAEKGYAHSRLAEERGRSAIERVRKWGVPALLFSWLPVVGDALCFAAGWLGLPIVRSIAAILIGKFARYAVVVYIFA